VFNSLDARFKFTVDAAASVHNALLPRFWTKFTDGLLQPWEGERVWCNPPYSNIRPWVEKAAKREADLAVLLLPANRTEQGWWQDCIENDRLNGHCRVEFLRGRMRFIAALDDRIRPNQRPPFGVCLVIYERANQLPSPHPVALWDPVKKEYRKDVCHHCHGTGAVRDGGTHEEGTTCPKCAGSGHNA
jgi:phage N-6-adenine-methyltransferase